jgi:hypothetical protein
VALELEGPVMRGSDLVALTAAGPTVGGKGHTTSDLTTLRADALERSRRLCAAPRRGAGPPDHGVRRPGRREIRSP